MYCGKQYIIVVTALTLIILLSMSEPTCSTGSPYSYPTKTMNYKIRVDALKEECVFQYTKVGNNFVVGFNVIRGGDGQAGFTVRNPQGVIRLPYEWKSSAIYQTNNTDEGYYHICVHNAQSRYAGKIVSVYMATYEPGLWGRFSADSGMADVNMQFFTTTFANIARRISEVLQHLYQSKNLESRDYAILSQINYNIGFWSIVQSVIILGSGITQIVIIRRLFRENPSHGKYNAKL